VRNRSNAERFTTALLFNFSEVYRRRKVLYQLKEEGARLFDIRCVDDLSYRATKILTQHFGRSAEALRTWKAKFVAHAIEDFKHSSLVFDEAVVKVLAEMKIHS
jgi:hypothetical protein